MNNIDKQYQALLQDILDNGVKKGDRTGTGTISVFGRQIRHKMSEGFPLLTTKKMAWKTMVTELLWFLRGDTNIKYLVDNGCHIWDGDAYKNYEQWVNAENKRGRDDANRLRSQGKLVKQYYVSKLTKDEFIEKIKTDSEFASKWGELGPIYGRQWREWHTKKLVKTTIKDPITGNDTYIEEDAWIDQIADAINLLKTDPDSRRNIVNSWNPGEIDKMVLPPCHTFFQFYTRELRDEERVKLYKEKTNVDTSFFPVLRETLDFHNIPKRAVSLMWYQRSVDTFLGLPFNIASYALLLEIIAKEVNMVPDELIGNLGDVHLYSNHVEQAKEQITREPMVLPTLRIKQAPIDEPTAVVKPEFWHPDDFVIENYKSHPAIKAPLSN